MAYDPKAQQEYQDRLEKYGKNREAEINAALGKCLTTHAGRALVWWLLEIGRINTQPFSSSSEKTAFNCGEMNVGNQILARVVEQFPDDYIAMMKEHHNERRALANPTEPDAELPLGRAGAWEFPGDDNAD